MQITYATAHKWHKAVPDDTISQFGKNDRARIKSTLKRIEECDIRTHIEQLDDAFLEWFLPMYEKRINEKENPVVFDIRTKTLGNTERAHLYYSMTLLEKGKPIGGTIFSVRDDRLSIAYRTYLNNWEEAKLQASPSLYTEYAICAHAQTLGLANIIHGKDRNPYGLNSNIGLAIFKLSMGCQPMKSKVYEVQTIDTSTLTSDALILEYPQNDERAITKAYLVVTEESFEKYKQITKYPERLSVEVLYRS